MRAQIGAAIAALVVLASCGQHGPTAPDQSPAQTTLLIRADVSGTSVATVVVRVTGPDIGTPLLFNIVALDGVIAGTITLPAGFNRTIMVRAYNAAGIQTDSGSVTLNLQAGTNPTLSIVLTPLLGGVPITVTLGSVSVTVVPGAAGLLVGDTISLRAVVRDANGDTVAAAQVVWGSANPGVASVVSTSSLTARVTAVGGGSVAVAANYAGTAGRATITVATPTLVQHVSTPSTWENFIPGLNIYLPNKSLGGNCIIVVVRNEPASGVTVSVSDDQGNTYVAGPAVTNGSGDPLLSVFYALNARAGVQHITASFAGGVAHFVSAMASEWYGIAAAGAADGGTQALNASATSAWAAGSFTTGTGGDLIYQVAVDTSGSLPYSSFQAGNGFTLASADLPEGTVDQYQVQRSAGATNPTVTANGSGCYASVALALKSSPTGTLPGPGIRIVHMYVGNTHAFGTASTALQFPSSGNLLVMTMSAGLTGTGGAVELSSVTDGNGNLYTQVPGSPVSNGQAGAALMYYAGNATTSSTMTMTLTFASVPAFGSNIVVYDVAGAATSPFDTSGAATGIQTTPDDLTTVSLTPSGAGELVIAHGDQSAGTITGLVGSGYFFDHPTWIGQDEQGAGGAGNLFTLDSQAGHYLTTGTSPVTFVWTETRATDEWETVAAAFKGK